MTYEVTGTQPLNFYPGDIVTEVIQNVRMILATQKGTVPYDREFGLEWRFLDQPADIARARTPSRIRASRMARAFITVASMPM